LVVPSLCSTPANSWELQSFETVSAGAALTSQYERDQQAKKEREAALAIEQEKADAAQQQAWAAQQQAQADRQKADALMFNATKPSQPVNVIQQSQQIQQSPGWHLQNGLWYWY